MIHVRESFAKDKRTSANSEVACRSIKAWTAAGPWISGRLVDLVSPLQPQLPRQTHRPFFSRVLFRDSLFPDGNVPATRFPAVRLLVRRETV